MGSRTGAAVGGQKGIVVPEHYFCGGKMTDRILQSGTHIARITAVELPDATFEARVFVRLTREPEIAETYIPAGIFATFDEAMKGAESRAKRALDHDEF